jgi:hypothetical protein
MGEGKKKITTRELLAWMSDNEIIKVLDSVDGSSKTYLMLAAAMGWLEVLKKMMKLSSKRFINLTDKVKICS